MFNMWKTLLPNGWKFLHDIARYFMAILHCIVPVPVYLTLFGITSVKVPSELVIQKNVIMAADYWLVRKNHHFHCDRIVHDMVPWTNPFLNNDILVYYTSLIICVCTCVLSLPYVCASMRNGVMANHNCHNLSSF